MVVKYYLTNPEKESKLRLVCINSRREQFKFTTDFSIQPKYWDAKRQYAKKSMQGSGELNQLLEQLN